MSLILKDKENKKEIYYLQIKDGGKICCSG